MSIGVFVKVLVSLGGFESKTCSFPREGIRKIEHPPSLVVGRRSEWGEFFVRNDRK